MKDRELVTLLAEDCVQVNNFLFFIARDVNFVFCLNLDTGKVDLLDSIPEEDIRSARLGANIAYWNNELIFTPMKAEKIWIYNLWTREWHGLKRKRTVDSTVENEMFQQIGATSGNMIGSYIECELDQNTPIYYAHGRSGGREVRLIMLT